MRHLSSGICHLTLCLHLIEPNWFETVAIGQSSAALHQAIIFLVLIRCPRIRRSYRWFSRVASAPPSTRGPSRWPTSSWVTSSTARSPPRSTRTSSGYASRIWPKSGFLCFFTNLRFNVLTFLKLMVDKNPI